MRRSFVNSTLQQLLKQGLIKKKDRLLAVAADESERQLFTELGFTNVAISNMDERIDATRFAPFTYSFQDAQRLTFADDSFDFAFVSDGLHHCDSPHRALLEMYRVARWGVIVFEARDSLLMRLMNTLGFSYVYELPAVQFNGGTHGGVNNTAVPNFVYRWTEREFIKTIQAHNPTGQHRFKFFYGLSLPSEGDRQRLGFWRYWVIRCCAPLLTAATWFCKKQRNSFCMVALKPRIPEDLFPWLSVRDGKLQFRAEVVKAST